MGAGTSQLMDSFVEETNFDNDEIDRLSKRFMKMDRDSSGTVDQQEFLMIPALASNPLATRLIDVFDTDGDGSVDFEEFVTGLSTFSSKGNPEDKLRFAFKIYDIDRDGYISNGELFLVLQKMVGKNLTEEQLQQIVDRTIVEFDKDGDSRLSFDEFKAAIKFDFFDHLNFNDEDV